MRRELTDVDIIDALLRRALIMSKNEPNPCTDTKQIILLLEQSMLHIKMREEARNKKKG